MTREYQIFTFEQLGSPEVPNYICYLNYPVAEVVEGSIFWEVNHAPQFDNPIKGGLNNSLNQTYSSCFCTYGCVCSVMK